MKGSRIVIRPAKEKPRLNIRPTRESKRPPIGVTPPGYDCIQEVLSALGYHYTVIKDHELSDRSFLSRFQTVFLNCSDECLGHSKGAAPVLGQYVAGGGSIYASDFAADYIYEAFPDMFGYRGDGKKGELKARVIDRGLAQTLGEEILLNFDMPYWRMITFLKAGHHKYLVDSNGRPLLASFRYGQGQVVFTSFHNHAQPTQMEKKLLQFLVLKPLTSQVSARLEKLSEKQKGEIQETPAQAGLSKREDHRAYQNPVKQDLSFSVNWTGEACFRLTVYRPSGNIFNQMEASSPPCMIKVPQAEPGMWRYTVFPIKVPHQGFPYTAVAGPEKYLLQALP